MEDLIGLVIFLVFAGLSLLGRVAKNKEQQGPQRQERHERPKWPGPVAGPGMPGQGQPPWPQPPPRPQPKPQPQSQPQQPARQMSGEGVSVEGRSSMLGGSVEGRSSMVTGTMTENRARFRDQTEQWLGARVETGLHGSSPAAEVVTYNQQVNPVAQALASKEGLAQGVLLAEILGKPRALRPHGKR
ncbi:MAG: hypothetical protein ACOY94_17450 [Bacillota bacterium]